MRIPENTWEKRAPIMLCSNAPLLIMFSRVVCYAHNIMSQVQKADPLSDACNPYNVKLKFVLYCTTLLSRLLCSLMQQMLKVMLIIHQGLPS